MRHHCVVLGLHQAYLPFFADQSSQDKPLLQVAADTFLYTPLNVGLFFALMTVVEGGHWKVC